MVGAVLANRLAERLAGAMIFAVTGSLGKDPRLGEYDMVFFVVGEMRSGTSWL